MITFNELYITKDNKYLIIDVSVKDLDYYLNIEIDSIIIDNKDTYIKSGPSSKPVYSHFIPEGGVRPFELVSLEMLSNIFTEDYYQCYTDNLNKVKNVKLKIKATELNNFKGIFFVYVVTRGIPSLGTPCGMDNYITMNAVTNLYPFYKNMMKYVKGIGDTCEISKDFIDLILRFEALRLSIKTCNYDKAIEYYDKFFSDVKPVNIKSCGCSR